MNHGRLPWLRPDELDEHQRRLYDIVTASPRARSRTTPLLDEEKRFLGPFNAMLTTPDLGIRLQDVGHALRFPGHLPRIVFESIVLMVAAERKAGYEWCAHAPLAKDAGLSDAQIAAVFEGDYEVLGASVEPALVELVRASMNHVPPTDDVVAAVEAAYGASGVTEAVIVVGHYDLISTLMLTWDAPMPDGVEDPFDPTA